MDDRGTTDRAGRHFLQIPGPTNLPERIGRAISRSTIDHRGPEFAAMTHRILDGMQRLLGTEDPVVIFPSSGTGAWEAALVNTLSPGDRVLFCAGGHFATLWARVAGRLSLRVERLESDWRAGIDLGALNERLAQDAAGTIRAVAVVHNETSTGVTNDVAGVRRALDESNHPALLMVDTISSLGSMEYRHTEWGVDVTVAASQKGLMLPPGLGFNGVSAKALAATERASLPRSYWDWGAQIEMNQRGFFPYTPSTNLLFGLEEALNMLFEEELESVFARHERLASATRQAVEAWGLEVYCSRPERTSASLTAVLLPDGHDADEVRRRILERFDLSLGTGLGPIKGKVFRIGHLGDINDLMLMGTLCGVEMGLVLSGVPIESQGVRAAMDSLAQGV